MPVAALWQQYPVLCVQRTVYHVPCIQSAMSRMRCFVCKQFWLNTDLSFFEWTKGRHDA